MIRLDHGDSAALIDDTCGGRLASLKVRGRELIVGAESAESDFGWGSYPMVPFAGRVRNGRFSFQGKDYQLAKRMPPHAIHGTVDDTVWEVIANDEKSTTMRTELGPQWPFAGAIAHKVEIEPKKIRFELEVTAAAPMPAQVGWHPWFVNPASVKTQFTEWLPRDGEGMPSAPTRVGLPVAGSPVDDCFFHRSSEVEIEVVGLTLMLRSDCSHWVVYNEDQRGLCVEPQSGPPNEFEANPLVLEPGESLARWFEIDWSAVV